MTMTHPVLVLGIGNILLTDEGVGVHVVKALQAEAARPGGEQLPEGVEIVDGGTFGADLIDLVAHRPRVIVIDAVQATGTPGTILKFGSEDMATKTSVSMSLHEVGLLETLLMAKHLGCPPGEVVVFGIIPGSLEPGLDLTPPVAAAVPKVIAMIREELGR